jgi:hypothetical protein
MGIAFTYLKSAGAFKASFKLPENKTKFNQIHTHNNGTLVLAEHGEFDLEFRLSIDHMIVLAEWGVKVVTVSFMHEKRITERQICFEVSENE